MHKHLACLILAASSAVSGLNAQTVLLRNGRGAASVVVRGVVFDSLTMSPVANATVWLPGGTQTTNADDKGRFELDNVPRGRQFLAFSNPSLDSLGLGTLGTQVEVTGDGLPVRLTTPSFRSVWSLLCTNVVQASSGDSGIVWGTVRDANSYTRLNGATAGFSWYDLRVGADKRVAFRELTHDTKTDSTGNYYACGLPSEIKISSEATGTRSASGSVEYVIGERRLYRVDLLVSTDMVLQRSLASASGSDSAQALRATGTSTLRGTLRDRKGKPVADAMVSVASVDSVTRSNSAGEFTFTRLPAGSHAVQARMLGFAPASSLVDLRPDQTTTLSLEMSDARTLAAVNVRAERVSGTDKLGFEARQRTGFGYTLTEKDIGNRNDVMSALLGMPRITPIRQPGQVIIGIQTPIQGVCVPLTYLDGTRIEPDQITQYNPKDFRAIELYNSKFSVPLGFDSGDCGAVLFWSKRNPRW